MIKFTDFIKDFTEGKDLSRIKLKFHKNLFRRKGYNTISI